jgi:hypothetical protein
LTEIVFHSTILLADFAILSGFGSVVNEQLAVYKALVGLLAGLG